MADRNGYIGRAPSDSSITIARQVNQPTGLTTSFTFVSGYDVGYLDVYLNGSKLVNTIDYVAGDTSTVNLSVGITTGDTLEMVAYKAFNLTNAATDAPGDLLVGGDLRVDGNIVRSGQNVLTEFGDGSNLSGIVHSLTEGNNISLSTGTGDVTISMSSDIIVTTVTSSNISAGVITSTEYDGYIMLDTSLF